MCTQWQDNPVVWIIPTIHDINEGFATNRKLARKAPPAVHKVFDDTVRKRLTILLMINHYDRDIGVVEIADQFSLYHDTQLPSFYS